MFIVSGSKPNCSKIFPGVSVMTGCNKIATIRKLSAKWIMTLSNSLRFSSSLANTQGAVSSIYLFARETSVQISAMAVLNSIFSIAS